MVKKDLEERNMLCTGFDERTMRTKLERRGGMAADGNVQARHTVFI